MVWLEHEQFGIARIPTQRMGFGPGNYSSRLQIASDFPSLPAISGVSKRGWRTERVGAKKSFLPEIESSFLHPFSYAPLGEGGHISGEFLGFLGGFVSCQQPPANPFSKPLRIAMDIACLVSGTGRFLGSEMAISIANRRHHITLQRNRWQACCGNNMSPINIGADGNKAVPFKTLGLQKSFP